jgi:hypothetical protein
MLAGMEAALGRGPGLLALGPASAPQPPGTEAREEHFVGIFTELAKVFLDARSKLELFAPYCANIAAACDVIVRCSASTPAFAEYLAARNPGGDTTGALDSFLRRPMQHVLRYRLHLEKLEKNITDRSRHHAAIKKALDLSLEVANHVNDISRLVEQLTPELEVIEPNFRLSTRLGSALFCGNLSWLNEDGAKKLKIATVHLLVLPDKLIMSKVRESSNTKKKGLDFGRKVSRTDLVLLFSAWSTPATVYICALTHASSNFVCPVFFFLLCRYFSVSRAYV